jgi:CBS domain-containing protein
MRYRRVDELMSADVVSVAEDAPFKEIAELLTRDHISAVPVVDADRRVVGVVSEADLMRKYGSPPERLHPRLRRRDRAKGRATTAAELMSAPPITVPVNGDVTSAARLMFDRDVKRLPVVDAEEHLAGILSRHDLVRAFVRPDPDIRAEVEQEILVRALCLDPAAVAVQVDEGVVDLRGQVERKSMVEVAADLVRRVDGVVDVEEHLTWALDDTGIGDGTRPENRGIFHR